jgi:hypothetical protein
MSRESEIKELLELRDLPIDLFSEIQNLVTQPEQQEPCVKFIEPEDKAAKGVYRKFGGLPKQSEQEPVAWLLSSKDSSYTELRKTEPEGADMYLYQITPLYTSPQQLQSLSEGELNSLYYQATNQTLREQDTRLAFGFVRAIEKHHGIGVDDE